MWQDDRAGLSPNSPFWIFSSMGAPVVCDPTGVPTGVDPILHPQRISVLVLMVLTSFPAIGNDASINA